MQERLLYKSDAFRLCVCARCGRMLCHNGRDCYACGRTGRVAREQGGPQAVGIVVPYSFKLLLQNHRWHWRVRSATGGHEIVAMGIDVRIETGPADRPL